jgi:hypothetical protein
MCQKLVYAESSRDLVNEMRFGFVEEWRSPPQAGLSAEGGVDCLTAIHHKKAKRSQSGT